MSTKDTRTATAAACQGSRYPHGPSPRATPTIRRPAVGASPPKQPTVHRMLSLDILSSFTICGIAALASEPMEQALSRDHIALHRAESSGRHEVQVGAAP